MEAGAHTVKDGRAFSEPFGSTIEDTGSSEQPWSLKGKKMGMCAIVPSYNAGTTLRLLLETLISYSPSIVVVDDGSEDDTASVARGFARQGVVLLQHDENLGKGAALHTGFLWAIEQGFEVVVTLDSDLQHAPEDLPGIVEVFEGDGLDMLVGSRTHDNGGMPKIRRFGNRFSSWIATRFCCQPVQDSQCGYRIYRLASCKSILMNLMSKRFEAETEILVMGANERLRIGFAPITVIYPENGSHKSHYRGFWDTSLIVWFYTKEFCRRVRARWGRQDEPVSKGKGGHLHDDSDSAC